MALSKNDYIFNNITNKRVTAWGSTLPLFTFTLDAVIIRIYIVVNSVTSVSGLTNSRFIITDSEGNLITNITTASNLSGILQNDIVTVQGNTYSTMGTGSVANLLRNSVIYPIYTNLNVDSKIIKFTSDGGFTADLNFRIIWRPLETEAKISEYV